MKQFDDIELHKILYNHPHLTIVFPEMLHIPHCFHRHVPEPEYEEFKPDVAILRERSIYTICLNAICRSLHVPTILYNLSPVWDKPRKMDMAHKIVWKLTPEYRMTPAQLVGVDYTGLVKDEKGYFAPFLMEPGTLFI